MDEGNSEYFNIIGVASRINSYIQTVLHNTALLYSSCECSIASAISEILVLVSWDSGVFVGGIVHDTDALQISAWYSTWLDENRSYI